MAASSVPRPKHLPVPACALVVSHPPLTFGQFDAGGVLYHANYFPLYEFAREELLRRSSLEYAQYAAAGSHLPLVESWSRYLQPIRYGEPIEVALWISAIGRSSVTVEYAVQKQLGVGTAQVVHEGGTTHVFVRADGPGAFQVAKIPEELRTVFRERQV